MRRQDRESLIPGGYEEGEHAVAGGVLLRVGDGGLITVMAVGDVQRGTGCEMGDPGCDLSPDHPYSHAHAVKLGARGGRRLRDAHELRRQRAVGIRRDQEDRLEIGPRGPQQGQPVGLGTRVRLLVGFDASRLVRLGGDRGEYAETRPPGAIRRLVFLGQHADRGLGVGHEHASRTPRCEQRRRPRVAILVGHRFRQHDVDDIVGVPRGVAPALLGADDVVGRRDQRAEPVGRAVALPAEGHDEVRGSHELSRRPEYGRPLDRPI